MTVLSTVKAREALKPRRDPYWQKLATGQYIGVRKMTADSDGSWWARYRDPDTGKQHHKPLGTFDEEPPSLRYDKAKEKAQELFKHLGAGGSIEKMSVQQACDAYVAYLRAESRGAAADDAEARFNRWVTKSKIAKVDLLKLTAPALTAWRQSLAHRAVVVNPHADAKDQRTRNRSASALNRDMTTLRAALNHAKRNGIVTTDQAWAEALKPVSGADRSRGVYLDRQQRAALIEKAPTDLGKLLKGLSLVPLRPGALAALTVANLDKRLAMLTIGKDKAGADRRIVLPPTTLAFFVEQTKDKLPSAPLFARADGKAWDKDSWKVPVKEAAAAAKLPDAVTAYALRHSVITDLVGAGLDVLTVARLSGTSVAMVERYYGHLRSEAAAAALATLAL